MKSVSGIIYRLKLYFIINRSRLSRYGVYQTCYCIYRTYYYILAKYYSLGGSNVFCPACGYNGKKYMKDNICPSCWSASRHRLLALYVNEINLPLNYKILEVAPDRATSHIFENYSNYISIDLDSPIANVHMDLTNLGIKDDVIEFIVCFHVLNEIKDDTAAMRELYRILKFESTAIIQVGLLSNSNAHTIESNVFNLRSRSKSLRRNYNASNIKNYGHPSNIRLYGETDYLGKLRSSGFEVLKYDYNNLSSEDDVIKFGLSKKEALFVCSKKSAIDDI